MSSQLVNIELSTAAPFQRNPVESRFRAPIVTRFRTQKQACAYLGFDTGYALSKPSKMPCDSYSTPAKACNVGSKLAKIPGTVCSDCYALKGMYVFANVQVAMKRRLKAITSPQWTAAMVRLIDAQAKRNGTPHFRWHDSGDIQSLKHFCKIVRIAHLMPHITFWIPTRETGIVSKYRKYRTIPGNLIIRESPAMVDGPIPIASPGRTYSSPYKRSQGSLKGRSRMHGTVSKWRMPRLSRVLESVH